MGRGRKRVISGKKIFRESKEDENLISSGSKYTTTSQDQCSVDNVQGVVELPAGVKDDFNETIEVVIETLAQKDGEHQPTASEHSEGLQEVQERFKREISEKENFCTTLVSDKKKLETEVLKLKEEIRAISTQFQAASKAWELEKDDFLSQIAAERKESDGMSIRNESLLLQYREEKLGLECGLNDSKAMCQELLEKVVEDRHQWDCEKENMQSTVAVLQTKLEAITTERGLLNQQNSDLRTELESLNAQVNQSNAEVARLEDQHSSLAAAKMLLEETNKSLQTEMDRIALVLEEKEVNLKRKIAELETVLVCVQNDLDSWMATSIEKDRNIGDLQYKLSEVTEAKRLIEEKSNSTLNDVKKCSIVLKEENERFQLRMREMGTNLHSAKMGLESKNVGVHDLKTRRPLFPHKSPSPQNGKGNGLREKLKTVAAIENRSPNTTKGNATKAEVEKRTPQNRVPVKGSPKQPLPQKPSSKEPVPQKPKAKWL